VSAAGLAYLASETVLKDALTADACRWCRPPGIDESIRDSLVWNDRAQADTLSNLTGYVAAPIVGVGITAIWAASNTASGESTFGRILDDTLPVAEAVAYSQLLVQAVKFSVGRQRPRVRFAQEPGQPGNDDNVSFFSGHSALTFALATSAGMVARRRGSRLEPMVWALGYGLAGTTAFLRVAADEHYATDVALGSAFGIAAGYLLPRLLDDFRRRHGLALLPASGGMTLAGAF
jgi:membrane-associated phospholipid phosphatase